MKKLITLAALLLIAVPCARGANYRMWQTAADGDWRDTLTWSVDSGDGVWRNAGAADGYPTAADSTINIWSGYTVTVSSADSVTIDQVFVMGLLVQNGGRINVNQGSGDDLQFISTGAFQRFGGTIEGPGTMRFGYGTRYVHGMDGGDIPRAFWEYGSVLEFDSVKTARSCTASDQDFANIYWNCYAQADTFILAAQAGFHADDIYVQGTGSGILQLTSAACPRVSLDGSFEMVGGTAALLGGGDRTLSVLGNFTITTASDFYLCDAAHPGIDTLLLYGGYTHQATSIYGASGPDSSAIVFAGTNSHSYYASGGEMVFGYVDYVVPPGATLEIGDVGVGRGSQGGFTLSDGATLRSGNLDGLYGTGADTGAVLVSGPRNYSPRARYEFYDAGLSTMTATGPGLPDTVAVLTVDNYYGVALSNDLVVADTFNRFNGYLSLGPNRLELDGTTFSYDPTVGLDGTTASVLKIGGNGGVIDIPTVDLGSLIIDRPGGQVQFNGRMAKNGGAKGDMLQRIADSTVMIDGRVTSNGAMFNYGPGAKLIYRGSSPQLTGIEVDYVPQLVIDNPTRVTMDQDVHVSDTLDLLQGVLYTAGYTAYCSNGSEVRRGTGWVAGNMAIEFTSPKGPKAMGSAWYYIGDTLDYTPAYLNFPMMSAGYFTIGVTNAAYPSANAPDSCLRRYWTYQTGGTTDTFDLQLSYSGRDFNPSFSDTGHEASMIAARYTGAGLWAAAPEVARDTAANWVQITGRGGGKFTFAKSLSCLNNMSAISWQTMADGDWTGPDIWQFDDGTGWQPADSGLSPDYTGDQILVQNTINITSGLAVDQLRVTGTLRHLAGTLTVNDGPGDDLAVDGGYFERHGGATFVQTGQLRFLPYAQYDHFIDGGDIPQAVWDNDSYIRIDSVVTATQFASGGNQSFGYFIWYDTAQTSNFTLAAQPGFSVRELDVYSTNTYGGGSLTLTSPAVPRLAIPGGFFAMDSTCSVRIGQGGNRSLQIGGQFYNNGWFYANDPGSPGIDTLRLAGDFSDPMPWFIGGGQDSTFVIFSPGFHSYNGSGMELVSGHVNYQLDPGATVAVSQNDWLGRGSLGSFTMSPASILQINDTAGIAATGIDSGAVRVQGARNFSPLAGYGYGLTNMGPGRTGSGLPDSVRQLSAFGNAGDVLRLSRDLTVTDTLAISYNTINLNDRALTIGGTFSITGGYLDGTPSSQLAVRGGGAAFRLPTNLSGDVQLGRFTLDRPAGVALTGNLRIHDQVNLINGALNTLGYAITAETTAVVNRTNGWVAGQLAKYVGTPFSSVTYEVGDSAGYSPVDIGFYNILAGGYLSVRADSGVAAHVDSTSQVMRRRWSLQTGVLTIDTCAVTVHYLPGDFNPPRFTEAGDESTMLVGRFDDGTKRWILPAVTLRTIGTVSDGGSIRVSGLYGSDLVNSTLTCGKNALSFSSGSSDTIWQTVNTGLALSWKNNALWQFSADGGMSWSPDSIAGWYPDYRYGSISVYYTDSAVVMDSSITLDQVQVYGQLQQTAGTITLNDGPGDDLMVNGSFTRRGGTSTGAGAMRFGMMARYVHEQNGGELASAMWDSQAVCQVTGITNAHNFAGGMNQAFWNIEWNCPAQTDTFVLANDPGFSAKYLNVNGSGGGILQLTSAVKPRLTLRDGFFLYDGNVLLGSGGPRVLDVGGSFFVRNPGRLYLNDANAPAIDTLYIGGDYTHVMSGIYGGGPDSTVIVFNGMNRAQNYNASSESLYNYVSYAVAPGAVLNIPMGQGIGQGSPGSFTLSDSATLIIGNSDGIQLPGMPLGAIQVLGPRHYSKHATFRYNRSNSSPSLVTGPGLPDTVGALEMSNNSQDMYGDLRLSHSVLVNDSLMIYGYGFEMQPGCTLTIDGKAVNVPDEPAPFIRTTSDNHLVFGGSGDTAHLYVESMNLASLTVNRPGTGINLEMGGTMIVNQQLNLLNGPLVISGSGAFGLGNNASIHRRAASSLSTAPVFGAKVNVFYGGGRLTAGPELPKSPGTLGQLHVELVSDSVTVNRDLAINDTLGLGGGVLFVNGRTLSMRGPLDTMLLPGTIVTADSTNFGVHGRYCLPNIDGFNLTLDSGAVQRGDITLRGQLATAANDLAVGPHTLAFSAQQAVSPNVTTDQTSTLAYSGAANDSLPSSVLQLGTLLLDLDSDTLSRTLRNGLTIQKSLIRRNGRFNNGVVTLAYQPGGALVYQGGTKTMGQEAGPLILPKVVVNTNPSDSVYIDAVHTIGDTLRLDQGCLAIGPHALTVNKQITRLPAGTLAGGPSSILILGGLNDTTHVPPVDVAQLSVNRPGGMLQPDSLITVHNMLILTAGRLDNFDALHTVALDSGVQVSRVAGTISNNPVYHGPIDVFYLNPPVGTTVSGAEIPVDPAILHNLAVQGTMQDTIQLSGDVTVNGHLDLSAMGCLKVANHTLTVRDSLRYNPMDRRLITDNTSSIVIDGNVPSLPSTVDSLNNLTLTYTSGTVIDTIDLFGQLILRSAVLSAGTLRYAPGASLRYEGATPQTTSDVEFPSANGPRTLVLNNPTSVALHADRSIAGQLQFITGKLVTGANTITIDSGASIAGTGAASFVSGRLARYIRSGASLDTFPIGAARGYTPVAMDFYGVATPGYLTIASLDTTHPSVANPVNCLDRYWQLNNGGIAFDSMRVNLAYLHADFHGGISEPADENTMAAGQHGGLWSFPAVVSRDTAANTITLGAINSIADLALARTQNDIFVAPDTTKPYIVSSLPANLAANVHGSDSVRITFSEPVRKSQVVYSFLPVPVTVDTAWSADSTTIVFNHGPFGSLQAYKVRVDSVQDVAGNPLAGRDSIVFTSADTTLPFVVSTYPANGATGVNVNDSILIAFSKAMDTTSLSLVAVPAISFTGQTWDGSLQMVTLHHDPLITDTAYSVTVASAVDSAGHAMAGAHVFGFATPDTTSPFTPSMVFPADGLWQYANAVAFHWNPVTKAAGAKSAAVRYVIQTDTVSTFSSGAILSDTTDLTYDTLTLAEGRHYWRVRAYDLAGNQGAFSGYNLVGVDRSGPGIVALRSPNNNAITNGPTVTFVWQPAADLLSGISQYRLQCAYDSMFTAGLRDTAVTDTTVALALADSSYYWHVRAEDLVANAGGYSVSRRVLKDTRAPLVAATDPADAAVDVAVNKILSITFSEPVQPATAWVTPTPIIPGLIVTWDSTRTRLYISHDPLTAGASYSVKVDSARDLAGNQLDTLALPARFAFTARTAAVASTSWGGGVYRLLSVPVIPVDTTALGNFGDDLGGYSDTTWLMYGYDPQGTFAQLPAVKNGRAYWLASAGSATLDVQGTTNDQPTELSLEPGWNLIGDPFGGFVTLSKASVRSNGTTWAYNDTMNNYRLDSTIVRQRMWRYDDNTGDLANDGQWTQHSPFDTINYRLQPWQGYALYAVRACTLSVQQDSGKAKAPDPMSVPKAEVSWQTVIDARNGKGADRGLIIGVSPQAQAGYDRLDAEKPPLVSEEITAVIPHPEWGQGPCSGYQYDYRPAAGCIEWPLVVTQREQGSPARLILARSGSLAAGYRLYLVNRKLRQAVAVGEGTTVGFNGSQEFSIVYTNQDLGSLNFKPLTFGLERLYPNPFAGAATISYQVPAAGKVSLKVYNIAGQLVATLVDGDQPAGYYAARWNGRSNGRGVASGVYLVRLGYGSQRRTEKLVKVQ